MSMTFTKEEKEKLQQTLSVVVEDLRNLYNASSLEKIKTEFNVWENETNNTYSLVINKKEMYLSLHYSDWYMILDKIGPGSKQRISKIKDYNLAFEFLKKFERIREVVLTKTKENVISKEMGMAKIESIHDKYKKEATIEIEMPETVNKPSIEISSENGKNVGRVTVGPVSFKILTSTNVNLIGPERPQKVKKK